jgi:hypothetical protein
VTRYAVIARWVPGDVPVHRHLFDTIEEAAVEVAFQLGAGYGSVSVEVR